MSTVGTLPADTPPLSFLDVSSALSPWTNYQYRLVLHNQAGSTTGKHLRDHSGTSNCYTYLCVTEESLPSLFSFSRPLGRYHHQTISASWPQPSKGESPRPRLPSGAWAMTAATVTIPLVVTVGCLVLADTFECMFSRRKRCTASEALLTFSR